MKTRSILLKNVLLLCCMVFYTISINAQTTQYKLDKDGRLEYLVFPSISMDTVKFNTGKFAGPSLFFNDKELPLSPASKLFYKGANSEISYSLAYSFDKQGAYIDINCKNISQKNLNDIQFSMHLGINTCQTKYPEWRSLYFPTLMKCEKTHFWGYFMNPNGGILSIASPNPIASYRLQYNNKLEGWHNGHLIYTVTLDLLNPGPLPEENPENCSSLAKGESRNWKIYLTPVQQLFQLNTIINENTQAPFIQSPLYTISQGENFKLDFTSNKKPKATIETPSKKIITLKIKATGKNRYKAVYTPSEGEGVYKLQVAVAGKVSHGWLSVRYPWADYINAARQAALDYPQKGSTHTESWYGFFSAYIARHHFPNKTVDEKVDQLFDEVFAVMYDTITFLPLHTKNRIQNHALMASLLVDRYKATKDISDLERAVILVDYIITKQTKDGAYRNHSTHYTSVIYIAKAILEVMEEEKKLSETSQYWALNYSKHYSSVKKAMDELTLNLDNIQTEGENTYEDGMISCSYTQLSMFALLHPHGSVEREKYIKAAEHFANGHRSLSQLMIPDSRVNGASIRFWESQYDILTFPNFVNSPHGWSAWRLYGLKYLYQLTGKEYYLTSMMNGMGSCAQLLNPKTGKLNWAFVADPYVKVKYFTEDPNNKGKGIHIRKVVGRQYLPMISDWYKAPKNKSVSGYGGYDGGSCDNDVHEIFKCMEEVALNSAYFHLRPDGSIITWNCKATKDGDKWNVEKTEKTVTTLYTNTTKVSTDDIQVEIVNAI